MFSELTQDPGHQTDEHGENHKGPVPGVRPGHGGDPQEDEDERLTHAAPHLQEVFDGGVGLVGDVGLHVRSHHDATGDQPRLGGKKKKKETHRMLMSMV